MENNICPKCGSLLPPESNFCSNCGFQIKQVPLTVSLGKQIGVYALSFFLPPLGLWPAIKYLKSGNSNVQKVGIVAVILTAISIIVTLYFTVSIMNSFTQTLNSQLGQSPGFAF